MNIKVIFEKASKYVVKNAPTIMTIIGIGGFATTVGLAIKETPKANEALEKLKEEKKDANALDKAKVLIPIYWPMATTGVISVCCVIFANHMNLKRYATLLAMYKISEDNKDRIEEQMRKILGNTKTEEVFDAVNKELVKETPLEPEMIIQTGKGNTRFMDGLSRQRFYSSPQEVGAAFNRLNHRLMLDDTVCLNDLMDELGLLPLDPAYILGTSVGGSGLGDRLGWRMDKMGNLIEYRITYVNDVDGEPIGIVSYSLDDNPVIFYD